VPSLCPPSALTRPTPQGSLKLIDFGIAKALSNDTTNIVRDSQVGTVNYMSPESITADMGARNGQLKVCACVCARIGGSLVVFGLPCASVLGCAVLLRCLSHAREAGDDALPPWVPACTWEDGRVRVLNVNAPATDGCTCAAVALG
jgi:serine/threonine protein kinase